MRKLLFGLVVAALATPAFAGEYNKTVSVGQQAPTFAGVPAIDKTGEQTSVSLSDMKEDVIVLVFLANHCPAVVASEDRIIDFVKDYQGKSVKVVGVSVSLQDQDRLPGIKSYKKEKGSNYVYAYDETQEIGKAYGASATPTFFVLDKARKIRYMGAQDDNTMKEDKVAKHYLRDAVDAVLAGKTPAVTETRAVGCGIRYEK